MGDEEETEIIELLKEFREEQNRKHQEHHENCKTLQGAVEEMRTVLIGDFKTKGFIGRVARNEEEIAALKEAEKERTQKGGLAGATAGATVGGVIVAIKAWLGSGGG